MSSSSASKRKSSDSRRSSSGNNPSATLSGSGVQGEANSKPRASVFSRLGTKGGGQAWSEGRDGRERDRDREKERKGATPKRPAGKDSSVSGSKKPLSGKGGAGSGHRNSPAIDTNWEAWNEKNLDHDDELMLEKKRQLLKRELAKEVKDGKPKPEAGAGVSAQKRTGQSSSSGSSSSSEDGSDSTGSSSDSTAEESEVTPKKRARKKLPDSPSKRRSGGDSQRPSSRSGKSAAMRSSGKSDDGVLKKKKKRGGGKRKRAQAAAAAAARNREEARRRSGGLAMGESSGSSGKKVSPKKHRDQQERPGQKRKSKLSAARARVGLLRAADSSKGFRDKHGSSSTGSKSSVKRPSSSAGKRSLTPPSRSSSKIGKSSHQHGYDSSRRSHSIDRSSSGRSGPKPGSPVPSHRARQKSISPPPNHSRRGSRSPRRSPSPRRRDMGGGGSGSRGRSRDHSPPRGRGRDRTPPQSQSGRTSFERSGGGGDFRASSRDRDLRRDIDNRRTSGTVGAAARRSREREKRPGSSSGRAGSSRDRGRGEGWPATSDDRDYNSGSSRRGGERAPSPRGGGFGRGRDREQGWRGTGDSSRSSPRGGEWGDQASGGRDWRDRSPIGGRGRRLGRGGGGGGGGGGGLGSGGLTGGNSIRIDGRGGGFGDGGWMDGERGLRRERGGRRSRSRERLLPPEVLKHNRDNRRQSPKAGTSSSQAASSSRPGSTSPSGRSSRRSRSREKARSRSAEGGRASSPTSVGERSPAEKEDDEATTTEEREDGEELEDPDGSIDMGQDDSSNADPAEAEKGDADKFADEQDAAGATAATATDEVFSDFGESDEEILTKEGEADLGDDAAEHDARAESRTSSQKNKDGNLLEGMSDDLDEVSPGEDDVDGAGKAKGALEVDWSELMSKPNEPKPAALEGGFLKKRWSMAALLNSMSLSSSLFSSEEAYQRLIEKANANVEESEKFKPKHRESYMDLYMKRREQRRKSLLSDFGPNSRALTARKDLEIRRFLCRMNADDSPAVTGTPNTNWEWFRHFSSIFAEDDTKDTC